MTVKYTLIAKNFVSIGFERIPSEYDVVRLEGELRQDEQHTVVFNDQFGRDHIDVDLMFDTWQEAYNKRGQRLVNARKETGRLAYALEHSLNKPLPFEPTDAISTT